MNLFGTIFLNIIYILFPLVVYLFYMAYNQNVGKKENNLYLDFALYTSLYLTMRYGVEFFSKATLLIFNVPLIVAYIKNRDWTAYLLSFLIICYYTWYFKVSIFFFILEYFIYCLLNLWRKKAKFNELTFVHMFVLVKAFLFSILMYLTRYLGVIDLASIVKIMLLIIVLYTTTCLVLYMFAQGEDILKLHMTLKELEQEKQIRASLFKITHEIKNPIAVCKGYLDMFDVNNIEHSKKYVPIIREEIERTLILLQDFLCMTKIKIDKDLIDINMLLEDVLESFRPILKDKNIESELNTIDDEIYIYGDYNRLTQVLLNLIKNSIEAIPNKRKGSLCISTMIYPHEIAIEIEDNGSGIDKNILDKMKEPFYTTKQKGTGLGVSLSYEIIEAHHGTIEYKSVVGEGTQVLITLPRTIL